MQEIQIFPLLKNDEAESFIPMEGFGCIYKAIVNS